MAEDSAKTEIELIVGWDQLPPRLKLLRDFGYRYRTSVIQHTHRLDSVDAYFDRALWWRVLEFAQTFGSISIIDRPWGGPDAPSRDWQSGKAQQPTIGHARPLAEFLERWDESYPPELIVAWNPGGSVPLCIVTEYWVQTGGPHPYADSFTYSIYSDGELSDRIDAFLRASENASEWSISPEKLYTSGNFG